MRSSRPASSRPSTSSAPSAKSPEAGAGPRRAARSFRKRLRSLIELEGFLRGLGWLGGSELDRALIVTGEVLDNIVAHSARRPLARVLFRVRAGRRTTILVRFKEREFAGFVAKLDSYAPYFDERTHRQRGLGLLLCERLSARIRYRSGTVWQSVLIEL